MAQIYSTTKDVNSSGYGAGSFRYRIRVDESNLNENSNTGRYIIYFDVMPIKSRYSGWSDTNATFRITTSNGQSINADNNIRGSKSPMTYNSYTNIGSWTGDLTHKEDGSLTITVSITYGWSSSDGNYLPLETNISGTATATIIARNPLVKFKVNGTYVNGKVSVKVNGEWKSAKKVYIKVNGEWKENSLKG